MLHRDWISANELTHLSIDEPRHYFAQMQAYQSMPDEELFNVQEVILNKSIEQIVSRPGVRVNCDVCGEEIMNEREFVHESMLLCRTCVGSGYYQSVLDFTLPTKSFIPRSTRKIKLPVSLPAEN